MNPPRAAPRRLNWPAIILAELAKLAAERAPLPNHDELCVRLDMERTELQRHMRALEMRHVIRVLRGTRNERVAIYAADGSWRLERPRPEKEAANIKDCNNCGEPFIRPSRFRFVCDACNERPWRVLDGFTASPTGKRKTAKWG